MPTFTPNFNFSLPLVNDPTDEDLWGGELNGNTSSLDGYLLTAQNFIKRVVTTTDVATAADKKKLLLGNATAGSYVQTLPLAVTAGDGLTISFSKTDATLNTITITRAGSDTIGSGVATTYILSNQDDVVTLVSDGVSRWNFQSKNTVIADASTTTKGIVALATNAEAISGVDTAKAIVSSSLKAVLTALGFGTRYESPLTSWTNGSVQTFTHGLGSIPKLVVAELVCQVTEQGYAVGDRIGLSSWIFPSSQNYGSTVSYNTTTVSVTIGSSGYYISSKDGTNRGLLTPTNWRIQARVWS